jgi:hypothetical protein
MTWTSSSTRTRSLSVAASPFNSSVTAASDVPCAPVKLALAMVAEPGAARSTASAT